MRNLKILFILCTVLVNVSNPAYANRRPDYVPGELLVKYKSPFRAVASRMEARPPPVPGADIHHNSTNVPYCQVNIYGYPKRNLHPGECRGRHPLRLDRFSPTRTTTLFPTILCFDLPTDWLRISLSWSLFWSLASATMLL